MRRIVLMLIFISFLYPAGAFSQPVPPAPGVEIPGVPRQGRQGRRGRFSFSGRGLQKARRAKGAREEFLSAKHPEGMSFASLPDGVKNSMMVSGNGIRPPCCWASSRIRGTIPTRGHAPGQAFHPSARASMTALYDEMSYGSLNLTGTVSGMVTRSSDIDTYYEGPGGCFGLCAYAKTGQFNQGGFCSSRIHP